VGQNHPVDVGASEVAQLAKLENVLVEETGNALGERMTPTEFHNRGELDPVRAISREMPFAALETIGGGAFSVLMLIFHIVMLSGFCFLSRFNFR